MQHLSSICVVCVHSEEVHMEVLATFLTGLL